MNIEDKREREKRPVRQMIGLYCRKKHGGKTFKNTGKLYCVPPSFAGSRDEHRLRGGRHHFVFVTHTHLY